MCVFLARLTVADRQELGQIILFYTSLAIFTAALAVRFVFHRDDTSSSLHYVYKLMVIVFVYFALIIFMLCDIFLV